MHKNTLIAFWLFFAGFIGGAQAASFDCDKAASEVEKMICADYVLSNLDVGVSSVYARMVFRSADPAKVRAEQRSWLKNTRNVCQTVQCVEVAYKQRLLGLLAVPITYADLDTAIDATCREIAVFESYDTPGMCRLSKSGNFGSLDSSDFYYALYCVHDWAPGQGPGNCMVSSMALFAQNKHTGVVERFHEHAADADSYFSAPTISTDENDTFLLVPVRVGGTGNFNDNDYFIRRQNRWVLMDTQSWLSDLDQYIPSGFEILKGVEPDVSSMTASAALYQPGDANCCPSGGLVDIHLKVAGNRLAIKSVEIVAPQAESEPVSGG